MPPGYHKTSISLSPEVATAAAKRARELGFENSFSAYIQKLIREDLARDAGALHEHPAPPLPPPRPPGGPVTYRKVRRVRKASN